MSGGGHIRMLTCNDQRHSLLPSLPLLPPSFGPSGRVCALLVLAPNVLRRDDRLRREKAFHQRSRGVRARLHPTTARLAAARDAAFRAEKHSQ